jgi:hypothetical protein
MAPGILQHLWMNLGGLQAVYHIWTVHEKELQKLFQQTVV